MVLYSVSNYQNNLKSTLNLTEKDCVHPEVKSIFNLYWCCSKPVWLYLFLCT